MALTELSRCSCSSSLGASFGVGRDQCAVAAGGRKGVLTRAKGAAQRVARIVIASSGERAAGGADQLSGQEFFESFLRRRQADGDFVSRAAGVLWKKEVIELDEESKQRMREKLYNLQKQNEGDDNGSFLRLSQARDWSLGKAAVAAPTNPNKAFLDRERGRNDRKMQSQLEYEALKRELSLMTTGIAIAVGAYCIITLSPEATLSYGVGAAASLAYLQLLYKHVDEVSEDNVAQIFLERRKKKIGITSADVKESFEKFIRGSFRALSSPRLVIPAALYGLWVLTERFAEDSPIHLQVVPLMLGFFAYKAAALVQAYRDNVDVAVLLTFPDRKGKEGPEDSSLP